MIYVVTAILASTRKLEKLIGILQIAIVIVLVLQVKVVVQLSQKQLIRFVGGEMFHHLPPNINEGWDHILTEQITTKSYPLWVKR